MTEFRPRRRVLAAPILGERGGGIGQVSQLLWQSIQDSWNGSADLVTLLRDGFEQPAASDKLRFGLEMAGKQLFERPRWILFSHLRLARVERYVPSTWRTPYAVFLHGIECWTPLSGGDVEVVSRAALRIANSAFTARRAAEVNPGIGEIAICPLALPAHPVGLPSDAPRAGGDRTVLVVGRLSAGERYKGHEQLLRAWPAVAARAPGTRLVIVGDGDDAPRLRQVAASLPLGALVEFTGFLSREQLDREYARASVFALPSRGEGFGLVYLEAMAHGLPCVGSVHDAAAEVIVDGETGVLVDPGDHERMGRAICALLEHPQRAREMGEAGRNRVLEHFTYDRFHRRITDLLGQAFDGPRGDATG